MRAKTFSQATDPEISKFENFRRGLEKPTTKLEEKQYFVSIIAI